MMRSFLSGPPKPRSKTTRAVIETVGTCSPVNQQRQATSAIFTGYLSDLSDDESQVEDDCDLDGDADDERCTHTSNDKTSISPVPETRFQITQPPPLKCRRLDVPYRVGCQQLQEERRLLLEKALFDIEKLIASKKTKFEAGRGGLQARRAQAIQVYLFMVLKNKRKGVDASERAAEAQGFAAEWGGRLVRNWVRKWVDSQMLPKSKRGRHVKSFSLLEDPAIRAELRSFLRSNKWAINPSKVVEFSQQKMIPAAADKYLRKLIDDEMPRGLKQYIEVELFPQVNQKVGKGVSLKAAQKFLRKEGFRYVEHKKGLYYDGHERPDVVEYRQKEFLPQMEAFRRRLVEYQPGNEKEEVIKTPDNFVERRLVLVPQDEMTAQANDGVKKSWVLDGEQPLKKKGVGRGIHQSDIVCATFGWLEEASQSLEYGKNYEGYWNGELFVKQVC
jgi:hypothetical protein